MLILRGGDSIEINPKSIYVGRVYIMISSSRGVTDLHRRHRAVNLGLELGRQRLLHFGLEATQDERSHHVVGFGEKSSIHLCQ